MSNAQLVSNKVFLAREEEKEKELSEGRVRKCG